MTVELIPNCVHAPQMGVANKTFFTMVNSSGMDSIIGKQSTNDELVVNGKDSLLMLQKIKNWNPPKNWGGGLEPGEMKEYFIDFFRRCDGFTTR